MSGAGWRSLLRPLVPIYTTALAIKEALLMRGVIKQRRLSHPVISVGSLSAGGAGKTPVVILLAQMLLDAGFDVRILTRGYGRRSKSIERVDAHGSAEEFGDEPLMLAQRLPHASVWVGADRYLAGRLSERNDVPGKKIIYLMDDGFQHRKLWRDVDVVLLTRREMEDQLLPAGNLREPLRSIRRAQVIILRTDDGFAGGVSGKAKSWFIERTLVIEDNLKLPKRPVAFCGLARPEGFFAMLSSAGVKAVIEKPFSDHHRYSDSDINHLLELAKRHDADGFALSEKDAVKLDAESLAKLERIGPVFIAKLDVKLQDEMRALGDLKKLLGH